MRQKETENQVFLCISSSQSTRRLCKTSQTQSSADAPFHFRHQPLSLLATIKIRSHQTKKQKCHACTFLKCLPRSDPKSFWSQQAARSCWSCTLGDELLLWETALTVEQLLSWSKVIHHRTPRSKATWTARTQHSQEQKRVCMNLG